MQGFGGLGFRILGVWGLRLGFRRLYRGLGRKVQGFGIDAYSGNSN